MGTLSGGGSNEQSTSSILNAVVFGFAHADNASAADTHAGALNGANGIQTIFEGVRADDTADNKQGRCQYCDCKR